MAVQCPKRYAMPQRTQPLNRLRKTLRPQRTPLVVALAFVYLPMALLLAGTGIFVMATDAHIVFFMDDAKAVYDVPFHAGALSSIGILLWCATATVTLFTSFVLRRTPPPSETRPFLLSAGLLTSVLLLDDLFLLHERVAPRYLGLSDELLYLLYAVLAGTMLFYYRHAILRSAYMLLLLSGAFLAGSLAFEVLHGYDLLLSSADARELQQFLEDGCKLLGIAGWFSYFGWTSYASLVRLHAAERTAG